MRQLRLVTVLVLAVGSAVLATTEGQQPGGNTSPAAPGAPAAQPGGRGGRGGGRGGVQVMTLTSTAWPDGEEIPTKYTQIGPEVSPALAWSSVPDGTQSFVLIFHDVDAAIGNGTDDLLHWMLWNIPASAQSLSEGVPQGAQLPDGTRQISASGPYYRGPGALASGPAHHYVFELFALDTMLDSIQAVGQSPPLTRAAVVAAMAGHVRGKAVYTGLFKR